MEIGRYLKRAIKFIISGIPEYHTVVELKELSPNNQLVGRNIVITGGGRGLGYYMAKKSIANGARVLITGRNEDTLKKAVAELGEDRCKYMVLDICNVRDFQDFFVRAQEKLGANKIDSLISNAGVSLHEGDFRKVTQNDWDRQMDTNLKGNYFIVQAFIKYLESFQDKKGNIVVITSERSKRSDDIPYGLTKAASNSFIQAIASKVISEGIRINGVGPGVTASDMTGFNRDGNLYVEWQPNHRIFMPEEVSEVVNFLLSDISACISGEIIVCDQGNYISRW